MTKHPNRRPYCDILLEFCVMHRLVQFSQIESDVFHKCPAMNCVP